MAHVTLRKSLRGWYAYGLAIVVTVLATVAISGVKHALETDAPVVVYPLAVIISAYFGGPGAGFLSTVLSALLAAYVFLPPEGLAVGKTIDQVTLVVFVLLGLMISLFAAALQRSRRRVEQSLEQVHALNETLEQRVALRTAEAERRSVQLQAMAMELTQAEQRERKRLAQVLHDELQQLLVGARFQACVLHGQLKQPEQLQPLLQIDDLISRSLEVSRTLTAELSPPVLYEKGLTEALRWLASWMNDKHGLRVDLQADGHADPHGDQIAELLFQSVRELLFNVIKHARTPEARVTVRQPDRERVQVIVEDRGAGFEPGGLAHNSRDGTGLGLRGVRERLQLLGGGLEVHSVPGQGTRMTLTAPAGTTETGKPTT